MPYRRKSYRRKTYRKRQESVPRPVKSYVRRQITKSEYKDAPLMSCDILFTGDAVSTTPNVYSMVRTFVTANILPMEAALPTRIQDGIPIVSCKFKIESIRYQLRYQNTTADLYSTARFFMFKTANEATSADSVFSPFSGLDIDQPPITDDVTRVYFDKIRYVRDMQADEDSEAPGTAIIKGIANVNTTFDLDLKTTSNSWNTQSNDIVFSMQSNSTASPHPSIYGFFRIYGRVFA